MVPDVCGGENTAVVPDVCGGEVARGGSSLGTILGAMKVCLCHDCGGGHITLCICQNFKKLYSKRNEFCCM